MEHIDELIVAILSDPDTFDGIDKRFYSMKLDRTFQFIVNEMLRRATPVLTMVMRELIRSLFTFQRLNDLEIEMFIIAAKKRKEEKK